MFYCYGVLLSGVYALKPTLPAVGGNEGVGEVIEVGSEVQSLSAGDRVVLRAEQCLGTSGTFSLRNRKSTSGSLGEQDMIWEHVPTGMCLPSFSKSSQTSMSVFKITNYY